MKCSCAMNLVRFMYSSFFMFSLLACTEDLNFETDVQHSKIIAVAYYDIASRADNKESVSELLFTGDDIAWFNPNSREIKFTEVEPGPFSLPMYAKIEIKLEEESLFTIVAHINDAVSRAYDDLVLFYELGTSKYYLYDNWPDYWSPKTTEINRQKREENWKKFLEQLKKEHKLK